MKVRGSPETRFGQVSARSELSSGGKQTFKVSKIFEKNYEIKFSGHDKNCKFNWVQFRPDHNIDYYILIGYNLFEGTVGKAYNFKIPAEDLYQLIIDYGGYAHGTNRELGRITKDNLKGRNCEYALRINPNNLGNKSKELWEKLQTYITPYHKDNY